MTAFKEVDPTHFNTEPDQSQGKKERNPLSQPPFMIAQGIHPHWKNEITRYSINFSIQYTYRPHSSRLVSSLATGIVTAVPTQLNPYIDR